MRVLFHDFAGHPFATQLARALAGRGHEVLHLHFAANPTPKGALVRAAADPPGLAFEGLGQGRSYRRYDFIRRWRAERAYGRDLAARIASWKPDAVLFCNTPLDVLAAALPSAKRAQARVVLWVQDLLGIAARRILAQKLPVIGALVGDHHIRMEQRLAREADALVAITADFVPILEGWGVPRRRITVIPNWGPLGEIAPGARDNDWARRQGLGARPVLLYTGSMGLKHDPALVAALAARVAGRADMVVVSEGRGAEWLAAHPAPGLRVLPFQPYGEINRVLATGDVMVAVLEKDAGVFSVPSKVLSYLCAGRPILASIPPENLAAKIIREAGAGLVSDPGDREAFLANGERLIADADLRARLGAAAHAYARDNFDLDRITARFERILAADRAAT